MKLLMTLLIFFSLNILTTFASSENMPLSECKINLVWKYIDRDWHRPIIENKEITQVNHSWHDCISLAYSIHADALVNPKFSQYIYTMYRYESDYGKYIEGKLVP